MGECRVALEVPASVWVSVEIALEVLTGVWEILNNGVESVPWAVRASAPPGDKVSGRCSPVALAEAASADAGAPHGSWLLLRMAAAAAAAGAGAAAAA